MNPKNPKLLEETMNTVISTPNSSVKSSTTSDNYPSETRDSFYFPGCRKDANCNCEICIESMNATLDLIHSTRRSSLTKFSSSRPVGPKSPINFNPDMSTPKSIAQIRTFNVSPPLKSTARLNFEEKVKREKRDLGNWGFMRRVLLGLILVFGVEYGFSWLVSGVSRPSFSPNMVKSLAERSRSFGDLNGKFVFLKNELEWYVGKRVASCSSAGAVWKICQDGLLLNSRCVLYKSATEEVSIWGWPLQTAGLLTAEYSSRSFSIISGRVTEWSHEKAKYLVREANSTWEQGKWSSSVVQFDPNTWILEYRQSFILDNSRLISAAVKLLKVKVLGEFEKMKQEFWLLKSFVKQYSAFTEGNILVPT